MRWYRYSSPSPLVLSFFPKRMVRHWQESTRFCPPSSVPRLYCTMPDNNWKRAGSLGRMPTLAQHGALSVPEQLRQQGVWCLIFP